MTALIDDERYLIPEAGYEIPRVTEVRIPSPTAALNLCPTPCPILTQSDTARAINNADDRWLLIRSDYNSRLGILVNDYTFRKWIQGKLCTDELLYR